MSGLIVVFVAFLVFAVLDLISMSHGVDSRHDFDDMRAPARGLS